MTTSHGRVKRRRNFPFKLEAPHFFPQPFYISHEIEFQFLTDILSFSEGHQRETALLIIVGLEFTRASAVGEEFLRIPIT